MQYDVFISYSRKDYTDENGNVIDGNIVSKIKAVLKANGISYWFDEDGINSGDEFAQIITNNIRNSKAVVFISSENSNKSEWTRREIATATSYKKKIIPFKYDDMPFNDSIYLYLADLDFISCGNNEEKALKRLVSGIKQYLRSIDKDYTSTETKKNIDELEKKKKDFDDSRKLILIEMEKSSVLLKSLKEKYNETVDEINKIEKEICQLDKERKEILIEKLTEDESKEAESHNNPPKKRNGLLIVVLSIVLIYAIVVTVLSLGDSFNVGETADNKEAVVQEDIAVTQVEKKKEEAKPESKPVKKELKDTSVKVNGVVFDMVVVKGFKNGDFCIGKFEVTQKLWKAVMGVSVKQQRDKLDSSFRLRGEDDDMPIYYVSLGDCKEFVNKLNSLTGKKFRLPTEAEWDYAARGGSQAKKSASGDVNNVADYAWYEDNSNGTTHIVGQKKPNALGLYDMTGNVSEWCQNGVVRGGSWANTADNCRISSRSEVDGSIRSDATGFRLVME